MFSAYTDRPRPDAALLRELRTRIARLERGRDADRPARIIPLGIPAIDQALPDGGLALGALHEAAGGGADVEHAAAATLFIAGVLARMGGPVLWVVEHADLFAPGLASVGLLPDRLVFAEAGRDVLAAMEEGLRHAGLAAVVGEVSGRLTLVASRRLHLAAEQTGILAVVLRRNRVAIQGREPTAAVTRWLVTAEPSPPALPHAPAVPGLGRARWRLDLLRCRGGEPGSWMVEACDAEGRLAMAGNTPVMQPRHFMGRISA
jgi:protein ImuA